MRNKAGEIIDGPEARQALRRWFRSAPARALPRGEQSAGRVITAIYARRRNMILRAIDNRLARDTRFVGEERDVIPRRGDRLGRNMLRELGLNPGAGWPGYQAHHIIPNSVRNHPLIQHVGMDFDHAANGIFLPSTRSGSRFSQLPLHRYEHDAYNTAMAAQLDRISLSLPRKEQIERIIAVREHARRGILLGIGLRRGTPEFDGRAWARYMDSLVFE